MTTIFLTTTGAGSQARPSDWQDSGASCHVIAGGGGGSSGNNSTQGSGGGGGGYSNLTAFTMAATIFYSIGTGGNGGTAGGNGTAGADTWIRIDGTNAAPTTTAQGTLAKAGGPGTVTPSGGTGGAAASGVGSVTHSGGAGAAGSNSGAGGPGGGGAGGPQGNGGSAVADTGASFGGTGGGGSGGGGSGTNGANGSTNSTVNGGAGGNNAAGAGSGGGGTGGASPTAGTAGTVGGGGGGGGGSTGASTGGKGGDGGPGTDWDASHGAGGGGGGGGGSTSTNGAGGTGGLYGGGGGGGGSQGTVGAGGAGGKGIGVIIYTPTSAGLPPGDQSYDTPVGSREASKFIPQLRNWRSNDRLILIGQDQMNPGDQWYRPPHLNIPDGGFPRHLRSFSGSYNLNLIGQDALPPGDQNFATHPEWLARERWAQWRSYYWQYRALLPLPAQPIPPGAQLYSRPADPQDGFAQWRSWTRGYSLELYPGLDIFPTGAIWDDLSPRAPQRGIDFEPTVNIALLTFVVAPFPVGQQSYANPPPPLDSFSQWRRWQQGYNLNLIGQDRLPPGKQTYSLAPIGPIRYIDFRPNNLTVTLPIPQIPPGRQFFKLPPFGPSPLVPPINYNSPLLRGIPAPPTPTSFPATYYMLEDHWINEHYLQAGTYQTTADLGGVLPLNWVPTPNVDPVDANAIAAYKALGFTLRGLSRTQFTQLPIRPPNYIWQLINGQYVLVKVNSFV